MSTKKTLRPVSAGSLLVRDLIAWFTSFVAMPTEYAIVCAVYAAHSYVYDRFDRVPYLSLTSSEPQCGKTTVLETMTELCSDGGIGAQVLTDPTKITIVTMIGDARQNHEPLTIAWDECEKASRESDERREIINSGYMASGTVPRSVPNPEPMPDDPAERKQWQPRVTIYSSTFGPKMFAGIGSLSPTIKDRSIVMIMRQGRSERKYRPSAMRQEAAAFRDRLRESMRAYPTAPALCECEWLQGREADLWEPLFTTARVLELSDDQMTLFRRACDLLVELKHSDPERRYTMLRKIEDKHAITSGAEPMGRVALRAMRDAFGSDTAVQTTTMIERLRAADDRFAHYRGKGLTAARLSELVATYNVLPKQIKFKGKNHNGYRRDDVIAACNTNGIK